MSLPVTGMKGAVATAAASGALLAPAAAAGNAIQCTGVHRRTPAELVSSILRPA
jgi:hypothetical protein